MENRLFVRNLAHTINNDALQDLFNAIGNVEGADIGATPHANGLKFAYVKMQTLEAAQDCIDRLNGHMHDGYSLSVTWDRPHQPDPRFKARKKR